MSTSLLRTRWAAIGAAVAVSLGTGGIGISQATTTSGEMPIYIPIEPCRLADTRPAPHTVGPRTSPLGPAETYTLRAWGSVGDCSLTSKPTGLSLNVTAVGATLPTFLTLFPEDSTLPTASHLNPAPGQPPTPNAVNVDLDAGGEFSIYNLQGSVNVIIDVVGYYDHHYHDNRYYTEGEVDANFVAHGPIVMSQGANTLVANSSDPPSVQLSYTSSSRFSGDGAINASLVGPASIGGVGYRLTTFEYCIDTTSGGKIDRIFVFANHPSNVSVNDETDRPSDGCHSIDTSSLPLNEAYTAYMVLKDGGTIDFEAIRTTWSPA